MHAIRPATPADAEAICAIYNHYILNSTITFEETALTAVQMEQRIADVSACYPWLLLETEGGIAGYAYATAWKTRSAYRHTVETSVYLAPGHAGAGLGKQLYLAILPELRRRGIHVAIAGIALPNPASIRLHEWLGFTPVGEFRQVGRKFGLWLDVGYWQLLLEQEQREPP